MVDKPYRKELTRAKNKAFNKASFNLSAYLRHNAPAYEEYPSVPHRLPQLNTRVTPFQHPKSLISTPQTPQFNTSLNSTHPSVRDPKFLSSTPKTPRSNNSLSSTPPSVQHIPQFNTKNPSVQHTEDWCWTEGFGVKLRDFDGCVPFVLNWGGPLIKNTMPEIRFELRIYSACKSKGWKFMQEFFQLRSRTEKETWVVN